MGKSNSLIFDEYVALTATVSADSVAFLGFDNENEFTRTVKATRRHFYDLSLGNWNINHDWSLPMSYDFIVSTRCPYFAKNPWVFMQKCRRHLNLGGKLFIDWGLGDHWRFPSYKVGWVRDGEHEFAYAPDNYLYSCMWRPEFADHPEVRAFWDHVRGRFGYDENLSLNDVVKREIPALIDYQCERINFKFLWPDLPQLYIMTLS